MRLRAVCGILRKGVTTLSASARFRTSGSGPRSFSFSCGGAVEEEALFCFWEGNVGITDFMLR